MASRVRLYFCLVLIGSVAMGAATLGISKDQGLDTSADWLGVIAGDKAGSETVLAAEMADLFPSNAGLRVVPMPGDGGLNNISRLSSEPHIDVGFVSTDVLASAENQDGGADLPEQFQIVARLCPQEVHVLGRSDIATLADLAGKKVNFGPKGGSSAATAAILFRMLNIEVEPIDLDGPTAIEQLTEGAIAAVMIVGAKPTPLALEIPAGQDFHLLPIEFVEGLKSIYLPTHFDHDDYPNLIGTKAPVPSVATGMVLLAAKSKNDPGHDERVKLFVDTLFSRFGDLQKPERHPKWREINLAAGLPGWSRSPAVQAWLAQHPEDDAEPAARAKIEAGASRPSALPGDQDQREKLFKQFMEWQRAKGH